jgi:hypothetical protein
MAFMDRKGYQKGINNYVPGMQYASSMVMDDPSVFSLGKPAASSDAVVFAAAAINCQAAANTVVVTTLGWISDSPFGRTLIFTISGDPGAATSVVDIRGKDYLGQPMIERFTVANGSTAIQYGKKAFYTVDSSKIVTASTNAVTAKVGTGTQLGLPYKGDIEWCKENGVPAQLYKRDFILWADMAAAQTITGGSIVLRSPCPGFVKTLVGDSSGGGSTTNAATTVNLATVAIVGLTVTIDQDTKTEVTDTPTTPGYNANNLLNTNTLIEIVHAATTGGGQQRIGIEITPMQFMPADTTDPGTVSTGDPRGTYCPLITMDGTKEIVVGLLGDNSVNASGNGGLHGIKQFFN